MEAMSPQPQATRLGKDCATAGCALVILLIGGCVACGGVSYRALAPVYEAFEAPGKRLGAALVREEIGEAYRGMARSYRDAVSQADFEAFLRDHDLVGGFVFESVISDEDRRGARGQLAGRPIELLMVQGAERLEVAGLQIPGGARSPGYRGRQLSLPSVPLGLVLEGGGVTLTLESHGGLPREEEVRLRLQVTALDAAGEALAAPVTAEHAGPEADNRVVNWRVELPLPTEARALSVAVVDLNDDEKTAEVRYPLPER